MKDYTVVVYETVSHTVNIEAENEDDAYDKAVEHIQSDEYNAREELEFEGYTTYEATCWDDDEEEED